MRTILPVALAMLLAAARPSESHRLDEYLQATRIALERDRIVLEIDLTPGVSVATRVFASLDRDADHRVSEHEVETYGRQVLEDLSLTFDGRPAVLTLERAEAPPWPEMRDGMGTIRLEAIARAPVGGAGHHRLQYVNRHQPDISVYLVNALVPSTRAIAIGGQQRDVLQHGIRLDIDVATSYTSASWIIVQGVALTVLLVYRRRGTSAAMP